MYRGVPGAEGAAVSAAEPYGFVPLEALPEMYGADTAAGEDVVYTDEGVRNGEAVAAFLEKVRLGIPCQLRTVQDYGENAPMVIDVLFQQEHFCQRMRQGREIVEERYSYVVTDGRDLYLSNGADGERRSDSLTRSLRSCCRQRQRLRRRYPSLRR